MVFMVVTAVGAAHRADEGDDEDGDADSHRQIANIAHGMPFDPTFPANE
jgi:hypothetical protein